MKPETLPPVVRDVIEAALADGKRDGFSVRLSLALSALEAAPDVMIWTDEMFAVLRGACSDAGCQYSATKCWNTKGVGSSCHQSTCPRLGGAR